MLHVDQNPIVACFNVRACFHQFVEYGRHGFGGRIFEQDFTACHRHSAQESARFNTVGHHRVFCAVHAFHAFDGDGRRAQAVDFCAHFNQTFAQIHHFWFQSRVFQHGGARSQTRCHHQVFSAAHGDHVHHNACALQALGFELGFDIAVFNHNVGTHGFQAFQMLIDRARTDGATARQTHLGFAKVCQSWAQYQDGRAHGFDQVIRCAQFVQSAAIDVEHADAVGRHRRAHAFEQFVRGFHVAQHRYIGQTQGFFGEQSRTHQR